MPDLTIILLLSIILGISYMVETCFGFGSNVIALGLGLLIVPLQMILPVLVLIGILQSFWNMIRSHDRIQWRILLRNIIPLTIPGMALGILLRDHCNETLLVGVLGLFILILAAFEIKVLGSHTAENRPLPLRSAFAFLLTGGIFQGLFASGGPAIVYYAGRKIEDPAEFRSTLSSLWQILNIPLLFSFWASGQISLSTIKLTGFLLPSFFLGALIGTKLSFRGKAFKLATWLMLFFIGAFQTCKSAFYFLK